MTDWSVSSLPGFFRSGDLVNYRPDAVGLCFSGGGYRATLFHAGAVIRLNELGLLPRLDRISSVSGGSITSGLLAMAWRHLPFDATTGVAPADALHAAFVEPVLEATARTLDIRVGLAGLLPFVSAGNRLADLYDSRVFNGFALRDLPQRPAFVFNATNLQTGGLVRFTRAYLADWRAFRSTTAHLRLADAVAASSAFPPVLAPLRLDLSRETVETPQGARFDAPELRREPVLVDGGVHDNLGLEAVWKRCGILIASYAGHNAAAEASSFSVDHMVPVVYSFLASSIDWRERMLINLFRHRLADGLPERRGAYWTAGTKMEDFPLHDGWKPSADTLRRARDTPTRLEALSRPEQKVVVEAGYGYADAALRSYLLPGAPAPAGPPRVFP
ncbi:patatin-like phospholipase family protein [Paroceanicella profunda]|nr:patatin-like phospholipase family protein [Paroceanicella profunda]